MFITGTIGLTLPRAFCRCPRGHPAALQLGKNANGIVAIVGAAETNQAALVLLGHFSMQELPLTVVVMRDQKYGGAVQNL